MEIRLGKVKNETTFDRLEVGKVFRANEYNPNCLFMKIKIHGYDFDRYKALDLIDGVAIDLQDLERVDVVSSYVVVE